MALQRVTLPLDPHCPTFPIPPDRLHYLQRVLRLQEGDRFIAMDGRGGRWLAQLEGDRGRIVEPLPQARELGSPIHLGVAMPKGTGMEIIIKQGTELGVSRITPVVSHRTLLRPSDGKIDRWRKIAQEAAELACRSWIPQIDPPVPLAEFLSLDCSPRYIGVTTPAPSLLELLLPNLANSGIILLTGPEGGWTELEQQTAVERGWQPISLAPTVLSATTAPIVALAITVAVLYY